MRITGQDDVNIISKPQTQSIFDSQKPASTSGRSAPSGVPSGDQIDLGGSNGLLLQAQNSAADDRAARIEQLRALVQSGKYQVDTAALSQSIVSATLDGY